jgi:hypothetical protein
MLWVFGCLFLGKAPTAALMSQYMEMFLNMSHALCTNMNDTDGANLISSLFKIALQVMEEMAPKVTQTIAARLAHAAQNPALIFANTTTVADYTKTEEIWNW